MTNEIKSVWVALIFFAVLVFLHISQCDREHDSHIEYHVIMGDSLILEWDQQHPVVTGSENNDE